MWQGADELKMHIDVDGILLFKSTNTALWPILRRFPEISPSPFPIAVFCGPTKPASLDEFLNDFANEMKVGYVKLLERDVIIKLDAVICDASARAMLKCC
jgi:hypothetical protein